jgi:ABC-type enterobactin transport system permease subunit
MLKKLLEETWTFPIIFIEAVFGATLGTLLAVFTSPHPIALLDAVTIVGLLSTATVGVVLTVAFLQDLVGRYG